MLCKLRNPKINVTSIKNLNFEQFAHTAHVTQRRRHVARVHGGRQPQGQGHRRPFPQHIAGALRQRQPRGPRHRQARPPRLGWGQAPGVWGTPPTWGRRRHWNVECANGRGEYMRFSGAWPAPSPMSGPAIPGVSDGDGTRVVVVCSCWHGEGDKQQASRRPGKFSSICPNPKREKKGKQNQRKKHGFASETPP